MGAGSFLDKPVTEDNRPVIHQLRCLKAPQLSVAAMGRDELAIRTLRLVRLI